MKKVTVSGALRSDTQEWDGANLRINEQGPSPSLADNDSIVDGETVIGEALDDPLSGEHRLTQHSSHAEVGGAGDVVALAL